MEVRDDRVRSAQPQASLHGISKARALPVEVQVTGERLAGATDASRWNVTLSISFRLGRATRHGPPAPRPHGRMPTVLGTMQKARSHATAMMMSDPTAGSDDGRSPLYEELNAVCGGTRNNAIVCISFAQSGLEFELFSKQRTPFSGLRDSEKVKMWNTAKKLVDA